MGSYETLKKRLERLIEKSQRYEKVLKEIAKSKGPELIENPRKAMEALFNESETE